MIMSINHNLREESQSGSNEGPSAYQPSALLLGQTCSPHKTRNHNNWFKRTILVMQWDLHVFHFLFSKSLPKIGGEWGGLIDSKLSTVIQLSWAAKIACWLEHDWKVVSSNPGRSGGRIFFSRVNFVCWLLFRVRSTPVLPHWQVKDPDHSAKSAGGR